MSALINADEVYALTGVTVAQDDIVRAQFLLETITNKVLDPDAEDYDLSIADERRVRSALAFQTVWMQEQVGLYSNVNTPSLSQDGASYSGADGLTFVLAPLARRALAACTWTRSYTEKVVTLKNERGDFTSDDNHAWGPMGSPAIVPGVDR